MPLQCIKDKTARQCHAKAKGTGQQCRNPAVKDQDMGVCRFHGYHRLRAVGVSNGRYKNGQFTNENKAKTREDGRMLTEMKANMKKHGMIK